MGWYFSNAQHGKMDKIELKKNLKFHHLGYVVSSIDEFLKRDNFIIQGESLLDFKDYEQNARVSFYKSPINAFIELIEPINQKSHLWNYLKNFKDGGYHHLCFESKNFNKTLLDLKNTGYRKITYETTGFEFRKVTFFIPKKRLAPLIEIVSTAHVNHSILPELP